jgi:hypothetical protein
MTNRGVDPVFSLHDAVPVCAAVGLHPSAGLVGEIT